jgi:hypothetical protein
MADLIQLRRDTTANWESVDPVLASGEIGIDLTTGQFKIGDGTSAWTALTYYGGSAGGVSWGEIAGTLADQTDLQSVLESKLEAGDIAPGEWGQITGTLASQVDLQDALDAKLDNPLNGVSSIIYVAPNGDDANDGQQPWSAKATIKHAVENAPAGAAVFLAPGEYVEQFPITFPSGVSMIGKSYYGTTIRAAAGYATNTAFLLNNGNFLTNFTLRDIENWAVEFAPGAFITRSPYVFNASVITTSLTAGVMHADGSACNPASPLKSMLNSQFTPVMNGSRGYLASNGAFMQCVSAFSLFNEYGFKAESGGIIRLDNCGCQFGNYGLIADGAGSQVRAGIVSFDEVGAGTQFSDIGNGRLPANYVVESNGGKVYRGIIDEMGDFSIGDLFKVEQATGEVTVNTDNFNFSSTSEIIVGGITLLEGAQVLEFSTDGTLADNSHTAVPTEAAVKTYVDTSLSGYITTETVTNLSIAGNVLSYVDEAGATTTIDLSLYLDDTNLARLVSGSLDATTGIATFTRDDATTFTLDLSTLTTGVQPGDNVSVLTNDAGYLTAETVTSLALVGDTLTYTDEAGTPTDIDLAAYLDDTNLGRIVSAAFDGGTDLVTFTRDDATTFTLDLSALVSGVGVSSIDDLPDVDTATTPPTEGQALVWDATGEEWVPGDIAAGGATSLNELTDVDLSTPPTEGQALVWDEAGSAFVPGEVATGGGGGTITVIDHTDSPYTASEGDELAIITTGGAVTVVAPAAGVFKVADIGSSADLNNITIDFAAKNLLFQGVTHATFTHDLNNSQLVFVDDGTNYRVFG